MPSHHPSNAAASAACGGRQDQPCVEADRTICLLSAYGEVIESEQVPPSGFAAALRRFHGRAVGRVNAVIVLDGITITRTSFLELVREFNETADRSGHLKSQ